MKRFFILQIHGILFKLCGVVLPEKLWDIWFDKVYGPWYDSLPDACDDCPVCQLERNQENLKEV